MLIYIKLILANLYIYIYIYIYIYDKNLWVDLFVFKTDYTEVVNYMYTIIHSKWL